MKLKTASILVFCVLLALSAGQALGEQYPVRIIPLQDTGLWGQSWGSGTARIQWWEPASRGNNVLGEPQAYLNLSVSGVPPLSYKENNGRAFYSVYITNDSLGRVRVWNFNVLKTAHATQFGIVLPASPSLFNEDLEIEVVFELDNNASDPNAVLCGVDYIGGVPPEGPAAPTGLGVDATTQDSATLSWTDNASDETGFNVERAPTSTGPFETVATLGQDVESYTQSALTAGRLYHYRVCAFNTDGDSPYSNIVVATTQQRTGEENGYAILDVDDELAEVELLTNNPDGYWITDLTFFGSGWDGEWGTEDDEVDILSVVTRNPDNTRQIGKAYIDPWLPHWEWELNDDILESYSTSVHDGAGNEIQRDRFAHPGPDGEWYNSDDLMDRYDLYSYDSNNRPVAHIVYRGPGADGAWHTADDYASRAEKYSYLPDGKEEMRVRYSHPGIDGVWFTADDVIQRYRIPQYDQHDRRGSNYIYGNGPDGVWFTGDDEMVGSGVFIHDTNGHLVGVYVYRGPGADGVWFQ